MALVTHCTKRMQYNPLCAAIVPLHDSKRLLLHSQAFSTPSIVLARLTDVFSPDVIPRRAHPNSGFKVFRSLMQRTYCRRNRLLLNSELSTLSGFFRSPLHVERARLPVLYSEAVHIAVHLRLGYYFFHTQPLRLPNG
jgi:hypothetical protein